VDLELRGQVAVVTGASKGIGLAVVRALVGEGVHVVAGARTSSDELKQLVATGAVEMVQVDLAEPSGPARLVAAAGDRIDILVNNVGGGSVHMGGFLSVTDEQWTASLALNLLAAVRTTRSALPLMLERGRGSIVNISSVNSRLPDPLGIDYSAAKAALSAFAKALSKEVGPKGIRVNTVSPGPVATDLWLGHEGVAATVSKSTGATPEDIAKGTASAAATGRFSQPAEIADLVVMLAGARTANVTGADFTIDGGLMPTW
jgi:NAD(P)-dependent dehydrogenase (short-subunit alcohol dehydrogenase family)